MNPKKCAFDVSAGQFLGFLELGIEPFMELGKIEAGDEFR
jgi:hypothetical protein